MRIPDVVRHENARWNAKAHYHRANIIIHRHAQYPELLDQAPITINSIGEAIDVRWTIDDGHVEHVAVCAPKHGEAQMIAAGASAQIQSKKRHTVHRSIVDTQDDVLDLKAGPRCGPARRQV